VKTGARRLTPCGGKSDPRVKPEDDGRYALSCLRTGARVRCRPFADILDACCYASQMKIESPLEFQSGSHLVLRPTLFVRALMGVLGACGFASSLFVAVSDWPPAFTISWLSLAALGMGSMAFGLYYGTMEVHATYTRLWQRRYWRTAWSIPMAYAGTTEGTGQDWALICIFDLRSGKDVGAINWWVLDPEQRADLAHFIDKTREAQGVEL